MSCLSDSEVMRLITLKVKQFIYQTNNMMFQVCDMFQYTVKLLN